MSGSSTPLSSTKTLSTAPSPKLKANGLEALFFNPRIPASHLIEYISSRPQTSSTIFVYDLAEQTGFGTLTKSWARSGKESAPVVDLQTRAGAGLTLVGRLSEGTSQDGVISAYTSTKGLSMMASSLSYLPEAGPTSRLVLQVPNLLFANDALSISPSLAPLATSLPILPSSLVILLSATPQEAADFAHLSYQLTSHHVVHIFDHYAAAREIGHSISPLSPLPVKENSSVSAVLAQAGYSFFDYTGDSEAETVVVLLNGPLALAAKAIASRSTGFGIISVNVLRPWDEDSLRDVLPKTARIIHILDDVPTALTQGPLYADVFGALLYHEAVSAVHGHRVTPAQTQSYVSEEDAFIRFLSKLVPASVKNMSALLSSSAKKLFLFSTPDSALTSFPHVLEDVFLSNKGVSARLLTDHDAFSKTGGITISRMLLSPKKDVSPFLPIPVTLPFEKDAVDFLGVLDPSLVKSHALFKYAKPGSSPSRLWGRKACISLSLTLRASPLNLLTSSNTDVVENVLVTLAFLRLYLGSAAREDLVAAVAKSTFEGVVQGASLEAVNSAAWSGLVDIETPVVSAEDANASAPLKEIEFNAVVVESTDGDSVATGAYVGTWHEAAKHILFHDAFTPSGLASDASLRPEIPDDTFLVTCVVNRRLTPLEYDRNVFHLEFDTTGTGLKYEIGEALGVHGWNDAQEVVDFCDWYGVDPNRLITIPVVAGEDNMHTRTVFQALQQQIDLFGRPPKSFYTDLAPFATSSVDRHSLLFIGSAEGSSTFKKLSEKDTVTFSDVLRMYPSARPGIERLCELVGDIKPRHYSIASAQSVVGDRIDLLVVAVDWQAPNGSLRYGQFTVSIKPSVMKLPPDNMQPLILAGLGTGAAPFRAFLQHRAWLLQQGQTVGPVYYYFGSRYQSAEYLYGEEIESFILDGVITRAGLAFSRDGPKKVYIQHKMLEDSEALATMIQDQNGVFYLCGPTWPVPDVYEALVNALVKYKGQDAVSAGEYLESLKEEERYVLEVY
ncbi:hypothetical protein F5146DRAFT_1195589 [Armillaria mellea]|nr:hypothetical protein F5146DRAFT_1195589 [Armillaria mellea]